MKAAHLAFGTLRGHGKAIRARLQRPGRGRSIESGSTSVTNERFAGLALHVREVQYYECPWELFKFSYCGRLGNEDAALVLAAWAHALTINVMFEVRRVRESDVIYVLLKDKRQ